MLVRRTRRSWRLLLVPVLASLLAISLAACGGLALAVSVIVDAGLESEGPLAPRRCDPAYH